MKYTKVFSVKIGDLYVCDDFYAKDDKWRSTGMFWNEDGTPSKDDDFNKSEMTFTAEEANHYWEEDANALAKSLRKCGFKNVKVTKGTL